MYMILLHVQYGGTPGASDKSGNYYYYHPVFPVRRVVHVSKSVPFLHQFCVTKDLVKSIFPDTIDTLNLISNLFTQGEV